MQIPILIEPLPDGRFRAFVGEPLGISAEGSTADEAQGQIAAQLQLRLEQGVEIRALNVPMTASNGSEPGWLVDDDLTREWLQEVQQYREECDAADRKRLLNEGQAAEAQS